MEMELLRTVFVAVDTLLIDDNFVDFVTRQDSRSSLYIGISHVVVVFIMAASFCTLLYVVVQSMTEMAPQRLFQNYPLFCDWTSQSTMTLRLTSSDFTEKYVQG